MKRLLVSACLLGVCCRYDGKSQPQPGIEELAQRYQLVPVCPEQLGGLTTPRAPSERVGERVLSNQGADVTLHFQNGAQEALRIGKLLGCDGALLKQRSPSCGSRSVCDGSFTGKVIPGQGVFAQLLCQHGLPVYAEEDIPDLLRQDV